MKLGERSEIIIKPDYAFGKEGLPNPQDSENPLVGPDETVEVEILIVQIGDRKPLKYSMKDEELI